MTFYTRAVASATDFYPASGNRGSDSGSLGNVGTSGYSWSSSPAGATSVIGSHLVFNSSVVSTEDSNSRSRGFTVRCVQE